MKIELKNIDFKYLYEWLVDQTLETPPTIDKIIQDLKPQYIKAFKKYQDEKQEFRTGEKVLFRFSLKHDWIEGKIHKVSRLANGQYRYIIKYEEDAQDYHYDNCNEIVDGKVMEYTNPMTKKNIRKFR